MKDKNLHKNNGGFKVPKDYFESLEKKLSNKLPTDLKENTALPSNIDTGFEVPKDYFNTLEDTILKKVTVQESKGKVVSLFTKRNILYCSGIAAMIAIIISLSINKEAELNFDDIEIADIHSYFSEGNVELSDAEMVALLGDEMNYEETFENEIINDDVLLDYISDEDLEDEIIFTE